MSGRTGRLWTIFPVLILSLAAAPAEKTDVPVLSEVYNVRSYAHPNYTRIVLDVGAPREYVWNETLTPPEITVDVIRARLNPIVPETVTPAGAGYIRRLRLAAKNPTTVRLTIEADWDRVRRYDVFNLFDPFRIVIDIYPKDPAAGPAAAAPPAEKSRSPPSRRGADTASPASSGWACGQSSSIPGTADRIRAVSIRPVRRKRT